MALAAADAGATAPEATTSGRAAYRPELDGLRAVAVYLVLLFHSGVKGLRGGFVGVDVFFVLSGFLVTKLLLRDIGRLGRLRFGYFYSRRFRRLLPAAAVTLLTTAVVYSAIATPVEAVSAVGSVRAAFVYFANWYFIHHSTAYFGTGISASPVLQFWSLAIEEQFYLLWPLLLGALVLATRSNGRYRWNIVRVVVVVGALASALSALHLAGSSPHRAYYGTDTRAYQLLAGGLLALTPRLFTIRRDRRRYAQYAALLSVALLLVLASSGLTMNAIQRGVCTTLVASALIVALGSSDSGITKRVLSTGPMVYLGQISYGTYLWHWLVILVAARAFHPSPLSTALIACLVATGLASLSYNLLERPIRISAMLDSHRGPVIAIGLSISLLCGIVVVPRILDANREASAPIGVTPADATSTAVPKLDWDAIARERHIPFPKCYAAPASRCTLVRGSKEHILVVGDSHAWMLLPAFKKLARADGLTLSASVAFACPWQQGLLEWTPSSDVSPAPCNQERTDLYDRVLPALHPDIVVLVTSAIDDPRFPDEISSTLNGKRLTLAANRAQFEKTLLDASIATIRALQQQGPKIVLVEPIPLSGFDPLGCLSSAHSTNQCRYVTDVGTTALESLYRHEARKPNVWSMNIDQLVCPYLPICDPIIEGTVVKFDDGHLTREYSRALAGPIDRYLRDNRILTDPPD